MNQPEIKKAILDNGIVVLADCSSQFRSAALTIALLGGSRDESLESIGITHTVEHLLFKRTTKKSTYQIACAIDELGGDVNAFTDSDSLCLHGAVTKDTVPELLAFFAELLTETDFGESDLAVEREVIRQEILEAEDDPEEAVYQQFCKKFWPDSLLGMPVFGTITSLESFTRVQLYERLREMLVGRRIVIGAAGDIDFDALVAEVEKRFGSLPTGKAVTPDSTVPPSCGVHLVEKSVSQSYIALGCPWPGIHADGYYAGLVAASVLGDGMSSRLFQLLREKHGLAYDVDADIDAYPDTAALLLTATVERTNLDKALDLIFEELQVMRADGVRESEHDRVIQMLSAQTEMEPDSLSSRLWRLVESEVQFGRYISSSEVRERLQNVTIDDIHAVVQSWLPLSEYLLVLGGDVKDYSLRESIVHKCRLLN